MKPSLFYGVAVSAWMGLLMGMALHSPWQSKDGGPQVLVASTAAAELARPLDDNDIIETAAPADQVAAFDNPYLDITQLPADPLPVIRLTRSGGQPIPAAESVERVSGDEADQVTTSDGADDKIADASPAPSQRSVTPISYTASPAGF